VPPPIPAPRNWVEPAEEEVVTVPDVVADDADPEHGVVDEHGWIELQIVKWPESTEPIPRLVAVRRYPTPGWSIDRLENEATPPLVLTVFVPDSLPLPGFAVDVMATVMVAFAFPTGCPSSFTTWTLTGPALGESKLDVIVVLTVVPAGCPPVVNASEHGLELVQPPEDAHAAVDAASIAAPSTPVAAMANSARAVVKTGLRMRATPVRVNRCRVVTHLANMLCRCGPCWCVFAW
jgi:hypothetical protein